MKKKLTAALLAVCMVASMLLVPATAATFDDVAEDAWYAGSVERWAGYGILNGNEDGTFKPEDKMTRAQFAKVVVDLLGLPHEDTDMPFEDVIGTKDDWAKGYIAAARKAGFINGRTDTKFAPGEPVSFNESAAILGRALGLVGQKAYGDEVTEKLTELGMLDENVKADAETNRALVAALADNMIQYYVTPETVKDITEDGVITGEVKGVILVVGGEDGVAVTVKDADKVPAIVMNGGNVTVSGETTVESVKVGGGNATVVAEEGTTVGEVTVEGTNVNVSLDGKVDSVTVTEDATISHLEGKGVSTENVVNESANEIKVNDETVAAKPAEENPDDNKGEGDEDFEGTGLVPTPTAPPAESTEGNGGSKDTDNRDQTATAPDASDEATGGNGSCTTTGEDGTETTSHTWNSGKVTKKATCAAAGVMTYTCTKCGGTKTADITALDHDYDGSTRVSYDKDKHYTLCKYCDNKKDAGESHTLTYAKATASVHTAKCECGYSVNEAHAQGADTAAEWVTTDQFHYKKCAKCEDKFGQETHKWGAWALAESQDGVAEGKEKQERSCETCKLKQTKTVDKKTEGGSTGGETGTHTHVWSTSTTPGNTTWNGNESHHWKKCTGSGTCPLGTSTAPDAADQTAASYGTHNEDNTVMVNSGTHAPTDAGHYKICTCGLHFSSTVSPHNWKSEWSGSGWTGPNKTEGKKVCTGCQYQATCDSGAGHTETGTCDYCGATKDA